MLLKNKEGNCIRNVKNAAKIDALKALGFEEVKPKSKDPKVDKDAKKDKESKDPKVEEKADGGVTVTL